MKTFAIELCRLWGERVKGLEYRDPDTLATHKFRCGHYFQCFMKGDYQNLHDLIPLMARRVFFMHQVRHDYKSNHTSNQAPISCVKICAMFQVSW